MLILFKTISVVLVTTCISVENVNQQTVYLVYETSGNQIPFKTGFKLSGLERFRCINV